ncbi:MAG: aldo/keto reductase [Candidatus Lernaella stagnicola]|nr:aldo/keto reductase [Candidatus Lernaella stagnicola]
MRFRELGRSGIEASVVGLGAWAIGGWMWGGTEEKDGIAAIQAAIDAGISLIDTAPAYGYGRSEEIVGKAIRQRRDRVVLATKCGLVWEGTSGEFFFYGNQRGQADESDPDARRIYRYLHPDSVRREVEQSLRRLGTDYIDLMQTHWPDATTPIQDTMAELLKLKDEGKIRAIGASNVEPSHLREYLAAGQLDNIQENFSMIDRQIERDLLPMARENGLAVLAYSPMVLGLLTGKIGPDRRFEEGDLRLGDPRFSAEGLQRMQGLLAGFQPIAENHDATIGQLVIAWTAAQPGLTHVLCGARRPDQAAENAAAGDLLLSEDELVRIDAALAEYLAVETA